jgi:predicted porin
MSYLAKLVGCQLLGVRFVAWMQRNPCLFERCHGFMRRSLVQYLQLPENGGWLLLKSRAPVQTLENLEMKKTLVALAALAATSAFAQSSVEIYGIVDVGYSNIKSTTGNTDALADGTASGFGNSAQSTSRLGFRGTEDLGGGTKAGFTFETGLTPAAGGTLSAFNNRQAFGTLSSATAGTVNIGRQYSPVHAVVGSTNLTGANNVAGDLAYTGDVSGSAALQGITKDAVTSAPTSKTQAATQSYTVRASNAISYVLPASVGFTGAIAYFKTAADSMSAGAGIGPAALAGTDVSGYGLLASKEFGPLTVATAYQQYTAKGFAATSRTASSEQKQTEWVLAVNYAVTDAAKVGLQHVSNKGEDKLSATTLPTAMALTAGNYTRTIDQVTLAYTISPVVNGWVSAGKGKVQEDIVDGMKHNTSARQVGANYVLSKRTNLYAIWGTQKFDATETVQSKDTQYAFGIRHQF